MGLRGRQPAALWLERRKLGIRPPSRAWLANLASMRSLSSNAILASIGELPCKNSSSETFPPPESIFFNCSQYSKTGEYLQRHSAGGWRDSSEKLSCVTNV